MNRVICGGLLAVLSVACGNQTAGFKISADATGALSSALQSSKSELGFTGSDGTKYELLSARANFRDIEIELPPGEKCSSLQLEAPAECANSGSGSPTIVITGPLVVDLLTGASSPDLRKVRVPAGTYKRIDFRLDDVKPDEGVPSTDRLFGNSFTSSATFDRSGEKITVELALKFNEDLRIEDSGGVTLSGDEGELLLLLKPADWLSDVPINQCIDQGDVTVEAGVVRLDDRAKGSCSDVENTLKRNLKRSMDLTKG